MLAIVARVGTSISIGTLVEQQLLSINFMYYLPGQYLFHSRNIHHSMLAAILRPVLSKLEYKFAHMHGKGKVKNPKKTGRS